MPEMDLRSADDALASLRRITARAHGAIFDGERLRMFTTTFASGRLFFARDNQGGLRFGSAAHWLAPAGTSLRTSRPDGRVLHASGETIFRGVFAVEPNADAVFRWHRGALQFESVVPTAERAATNVLPPIETMEQATAILKSSLRDAVASLTRGGEPVALTLSGGVDSSSLAAIMRSQNTPVNAYTVSGPFGDESAPARALASELGCSHQTVTIGSEDVSLLLPDLIGTLETWDPVTLQIAAPIHHLGKSIQGRERVLLTGYGADLIFAGTQAPDSSEALIAETCRALLANTVSTNEFSPFVGTRWGITVRYPFWTPEMRAVTESIPGRFKIHSGIVKYCLRAAMSDVLPDTTAWRPKLGIHDGLQMHRMFSEVLGTSSLVDQSVKLREIAASVFSARGVEVQ